MAHEVGHTGIVTRPDIYAGANYNPYTGGFKDFNKITSPIPSQGPTLTDRTNTNTRAIVAQDSATNNNNNFATTYGGVNSNQGLLDIIKALGGYGSGSGSGNAAANQLARDQFNYGKTQDSMDRATALEALQFGRARDARITSGLENYYQGGKGQFNTGFDKLLGMITNQGKVSSDAIGGAYDRAMTGIGQGYDVASGLGTSGFNALNAYLQANPNNPYAGMTAQVGSAPDALTDYLSAYGVSDTPVQGQIQADQLQAQQGAGNFQNLIDVLGGVAQQGAGSRGAESQMAQLLFNTGLGQDRAGYTSQAENAQAQALAALQQQMFQSRFGVEGDRNSLANQLAQSVINAGGDPEDTDTDTDTKTETDTNTNTKTGPTYKPALQTLVNKIPALKNPALVKRIETFAKKNPDATKAELAKVFPNLIKKKK